jgi:hypothetical protein
MANPQREPPLDLFPTDEAIAERAYELCFFERDTSASGRYVDVAEAELLDRAADRALLPTNARSDQITMMSYSESILVRVRL